MSKPSVGVQLAAELLRIVNIGMASVAVVGLLMLVWLSDG